MNGREHLDRSGDADVGFPVSAQDITPAWMTEKLRAAGAIGDDHTVERLEVSGLGAGSGFMGAVSRVRISYAGDAGPVSSVVVKNATPDPALREIVRGFRNYEREVEFFSALAAHVGDGVPRCFAAAIDRPTNHFVLVLEDLGDRYVDGDQVAGATLDEARACLEVQADLHARYWHARRRPSLASVPRVDGEFFVPTMVTAFSVGWTGVLKRFPELVPAPLLELGDDFRRYVPALTERLAAAPQTLVHSDFRLDNIMFARSPEDRPVMVLDWQGILVSAGVHDVAFLLSQNLADGVRENHERQLVEHYHASLSERGVVGYPLDRLWDDYRVAVLLEWVYAVIIGGSLAIGDDRSRALFAAMVRRSGAAIVDLDALELLPELPSGAWH